MLGRWQTTRAFSGSGRASKGQGYIAVAVQSTGMLHTIYRLRAECYQSIFKSKLSVYIVCGDYREREDCYLVIYLFCCHSTARFDYLLDDLLFTVFTPLFECVFHYLQIHSLHVNDVGYV